MFKPSTDEMRTRRFSEREPADSLRDKSNVTGDWLPSLTFALDTKMSAWRQAGMDAFPEFKGEFLAMDSIEEVWPFLSPHLVAAAEQKDAAIIDEFLNFAEWVLNPRPGSRPGRSLQSLTAPVVEFIRAHVDTLFAGRSRKEFFRLQTGLKYHLSRDEMSVFSEFLESTSKYVR